MMWIRVGPTAQELMHEINCMDVKGSEQWLARGEWVSVTSPFPTVTVTTTHTTHSHRYYYSCRCCLYTDNCHWGFSEEWATRHPGGIIHPTVASGELAKEGPFARTGPVSSAGAGLCWTHCSLVPLSHSTASLMCGGPPGLLRCRALMREQGAHQRRGACFPLSPPPPGLMFPTEMSKAAWKLRSGVWGGAVCRRLGPQSTPEGSVPAPLGAGEL